MVLAAIALAGILDYLLVFRKKTPLKWKRVWLLLRVVAGMVGPLQLRSFLYSELYLAAKGSGIGYVQGLHSLLPAYQRYWVVGTVVWITVATAIAWWAVIRKERRPAIAVIVLMAISLLVAVVYGRYHTGSLLNLESYVLKLALLQNGFLLYPVYCYDERAEKVQKA